MSLFGRKKANTAEEFRNLYPKKYAYMYIAPAITMLAVVTLAPTLYALYLGMTDRTLSRAAFNFVGLANYWDILSSAATWQTVLTTIRFSAICLVCELVLGLALALLFQVAFKGKEILRSVMILPMVATPIAMSLLWKLMFSPTNGIINYLLSLLGITGIGWNNNSSTALLSIIIVDIWQNTPFMFLIFTAAITALPLDPFEAAVVDGASFWAIFRKILLPFIAPVISISLLFRMVDTFKAFDLIFALTSGGPGTTTEVFSFSIYQNAFKFYKIARAAAMGVLFVLGVIPLCNFIIKRTNFKLY